MSYSALYTLSVIYSIMSGTAAAILSFETWDVLRRSPFGLAVFFLSLVMVLTITYHVLLLVVPVPPLVASVLKSAMYTGTGLFIGSMIWSQHRMLARTVPEEVKR